MPVKARKLNPYTVVGYYEDNNQIWVEHANGRDYSDAVVKAVKKLERTNDQKNFSESFRKNVCIVEVFSGLHKGLTEGESVSSAIDWPGLEINND